MQGSTEVLRTLNTEIGGAETVENVLENLRDEMNKVDDISTIMGEQQGGQLIDEGEIDDELNALEAADRTEVQEIKAMETMHQLEAAKVPPSIETLDLENSHTGQLSEKDIEISAKALHRMSLDENRTLDDRIANAAIHST